MSADTDATSNPIDQLRLTRGYGIAVVGDTLLLDGGQYYTNNFNGDASTIKTLQEQNWSQNNYLFSLDLTKPYTGSNKSQEEIKNTSYIQKPSSIQSTTGGAVLPLANNTGFIHLGGYPVSTSSVWYYNATDTTTTTKLSSAYEASVLAVYNGASAISPLTGIAYYLGGLDSTSKPTGNLVAYDTKNKNSSTISQFPLGSIYGSSMVWLPVSTQGILLNLGGLLADSEGNISNNPILEVNIYDIASSSWYSQTTTGERTPVNRSYMCLVTPSPNASQTHWEIVLLGGANSGNQPVDAGWVLSVPSFQWFRYYDTFSTDNRYTTGKANRSCILVHDTYVALVEAASTTTPSGDPDKFISFFDITQGTYGDFNPSRSGYQAPLLVQTGIVGHSSPSDGFADGLQSILNTTVYKSSKNSTSSTNNTSNPTESKQSHTGAIIGGVIGGIIGLLLLASIIWFVLRRRRTRNTANNYFYEHAIQTPLPIPRSYHTPTPDVHELGGYSAPNKPLIPPQELPGNHPGYK